MGRRLSPQLTGGRRARGTRPSIRGCPAGRFRMLLPARRLPRHVERRRTDTLPRGRSETSRRARRGDDGVEY